MSTKVLDDFKVKPVDKAFAEKSLDRVKAHKFNRDKDSQLFQSRHELLQKEYKKVIECHPSTFVNPSDNYDDTEFLNRMFSKDKEALRLAKVVEEQPKRPQSNESAKKRAKFNKLNSSENNALN